MKSEQKRSVLKRVGRKIVDILQALLGILVVSPVFGMISLAVIFVLVAAVVQNDAATESQRIEFLVGLFGIWLLVFLIVKLWRWRSKSFVMGVIGGLIFGAIIYGIVATMGAVGTLSTEARGCTTLDSQITTISLATVPITTNLGAGTAFAIDDSGTLLTAYHVVQGAKKVYANYTTGKVSIKVYKTAPEVDLALLKMSKPPEAHLNLTSDYKLGDPLYVFGYPGNTFYAGQGSLSAGIVSRVLSHGDLKLNYPDMSVPPKLEYVQTDAAMNPGNSGGPVVGACGVVGVADAGSDSQGLHQQLGIVSEQGISYAVSSKTAAYVFGLKISGK